MLNKFLSVMLLLTLAGVSLNGLAQEQGEDEETGAGSEKVVVCHKGINSISVGEPGLAGHLGHGDTEGYCDDSEKHEYPDGDAAVVMMHCEPEDGGTVVVTAFSSSVEFTVTPLIGIGVDSDCAGALAELINADFYLKSVTGATDYLLLGEVGD